MIACQPVEPPRRAAAPPLRATVGIAAPMRAAWRLASGLSYAYDSNTELNFNYALTWMGDLPGVQGSTGDQRLGAAEEFSNAYFHTVTWSVTWHY